MIKKVLVINNEQNGPIGVLSLTEEKEMFLVELKMFRSRFDGMLLLKIGENLLSFDCKTENIFETIYHSTSNKVFAVLLKDDFALGTAKTENAEISLQEIMEEYKNSLLAKTLSEDETSEGQLHSDLKEKIENTDNFLEMIKPELDVLFSQNEHFKELEEKLPETEWVKVVCDEENGGHYILGKLYDGEIVTHIAYGTFAENASKKPPEGMGSYCQFLPIDAENPNSSGYFVMYQDALTGENVIL